VTTRPTHRRSIRETVYALNSPAQDENTVSCGGCHVFSHEPCGENPAVVFIDGVCPHDPREWVKAARIAHARGLE
jgi:hypothetical protein